MRLLRRIRDFAAVHGWASVDAAAADAALLRLEVDARGLDGDGPPLSARDRRELRAAARSGSRRWRRRSATQRDVIEEVIEPYLMQEGFMQRTPRGRMLTEIAYRHLDLPVPASLPAQLDLLAVPRAGAANRSAGTRLTGPKDGRG